MIIFSEPFAGPTSDQHAAGAIVLHPVEAKSINQACNAYQPTLAEQQTFWNASHTFSNGTVRKNSQNPYYAKVTGGITAAFHALHGRFPTTHEHLRGVAIKWGVSLLWVEAQAWQESNWDATRAFVGNHAQGILQVQDTWPGVLHLRDICTAWNADMAYATMRALNDNPNGWGKLISGYTYKPLEQDIAAAGWFDNWPWETTGQMNYMRIVEKWVAAANAGTPPWPK